MTDHAELRAALDAATPGPWEVKRDILAPARKKHRVIRMYDMKSVCVAGRVMDADYIAACSPDVIRALLAERDALREALETMVEMVGMNGFGRAYAMDVARAALAQDQEET